mgnify:CR=1 FL=1
MRDSRRRYTRCASPRLSRANDIAYFGQLMIAHADHLLDASRKLIERYQRERAFTVTVSLAITVGMLGGIVKLLSDVRFAEALRGLLHESESKCAFRLISYAFLAFFVTSMLGLLVAMYAAFAQISVTTQSEDFDPEEADMGEDHLADDPPRPHPIALACQHLELWPPAILEAADVLDTLSWEVFDSRYTAAADLVQQVLILRLHVHRTRWWVRRSLVLLTLAVSCGLVTLFGLALREQNPTTRSSPPHIAEELGSAPDILYDGRNVSGSKQPQEKVLEEELPQGSGTKPGSVDPSQPRSGKETDRPEPAEQTLRAEGHHHRGRPEGRQRLTLSKADR